MQQLDENNFMSGVMATKAQELTPMNQLINLGVFLKQTKAKEYGITIFMDNVAIGRFVWQPYNSQ